MQSPLYAPSRFVRPRLSDMPPSQRRAVIAGLTAAALLFLGGFIFAGYFWSLSRQFPRAPFKQPSRLYVTPTRLEPGMPITATELIAELGAAGYREKDRKDTKEATDGKDSKDEEKAEKAEIVEKAPEQPLLAGFYRREGPRVIVHLRRFPTPDGEAGGHMAAITLGGGRVRGLSVEDKKTESLTLEPPLLASFYGPDLSERRPVTLEEMPEYVSQAVLAAEDDNFFTHPGVSPTGIARALWVNFRGGELQQGGSTITQQLVKNLYLTSKRSLVRKAKEAWIAVMVEARFSKERILEAYLNEIYWGKSGPANVIGLGAASWAYFGKHPSQLTLAEAATLAGMIQAPGNYLPTQHPGKAVERRDWVLQRLGELGWATPDQIRQALAEPLRVNPETVDARPHAPYFAELAAREADKRFGIDDLPDQGYVLFATLRWRDQKQAEKAIRQGLAEMEKLERRNRSKGPLQGSLISVDPRDGAILAYVGGRSYSLSQFDRVTRARRQAGSAFKPVVYAAAFEEAVASPASLIKDSPITVKAKGLAWKPQNYDRGFRGMVTVRTALEQSLNIPTVRLALQVGLSRVVDQAREMGFTSEFEPVPSLALGAFEATPYEMAQVYATFANEGARPELHGLAALRDRFGEEILGDDLPSPRRVMPAEASYLVTSILQGAMERGTASAARGHGVRDHLAGKTGTTNDRRDNWFAGYSPDRVSVVWVGYDDNARTQLSGARAALPIWSRFTASVRPPQGYLPFTPPRGIVTLAVDPATGQIATEACPHRVDEVFPEWQAPTERCHRHRPGYGQYAAYDPNTGEPLGDGYNVYQNDEGRIEISNFGYGYGQEPGVPEGDALPYGTEPLTDDLEAEPLPLPEDGWSEVDEDEAEIEEESSILIQPAQPRPPMTLPPAATPTPDQVEVEPEPETEATPETIEPPKPAPPERLEPVATPAETPPEEETAEPEATPPPWRAAL
ncbi:MAG TPA: PBP1A family penicillin-binding protein [Thermoanaerobaculia bacterium]|nr:PBP1A family penicillin-binding protein [Thermoanaerobaculia bacterium]